MWTIAVVAGIVGLLFLRNYLLTLRVGNYHDKHVFITGCDSGFGKALSVRLNSLGFNVVSGCLTEKGMSDLKQLCPEKLSTIILDVTNPESVQRALFNVKSILPKGKGLWALVNNAGIGGNGSFIEMCSKQDFVDALAVNLLGPIDVTKGFLPLVRQERGRVVCITSVMGRYPGVSAPYVVSKFGFEGYCDVLRREMKNLGVKVSILEPGFFNTNILNVEPIANQVKSSFSEASEEVKRTYGTSYTNFIMHSLKELRGIAQPIDPVIDAYTHAITSMFPKARYVVGWDAKLFYVPLSFLPSFISDRVYNFMMTLSRFRMKQ